jgi:hypothetical protein
MGSRTAELAMELASIAHWGEGCGGGEEHLGWGGGRGGMGVGGDIARHKKGWLEN